LAPRRFPENPYGNGVWPTWPGEVLHGDHQLMRPARFAAPPAGAARLLCRATVRLTPSSPAVAASPLCSLVATCWVQSVFTYNFNFVAYLGYRNITLFHIGRL
jgi:hypothetical protein